MRKFLKKDIKLSFREAERREIYCFYWYSRISHHARNDKNRENSVYRVCLCKKLDNFYIYIVLPYFFQLFVSKKESTSQSIISYKNVTQNFTFIAVLGYFISKALDPIGSMVVFPFQLLIGKHQMGISLACVGVSILSWPIQVITFGMIFIFIEKKSVTIYLLFPKQSKSIFYILFQQPCLYQ